MQLQIESINKDYDLTVTKKDEVYVIVDCDNYIARELSDYFTFYVPGYKFMPAYRNRSWDGKIRLFSLRNHQLYGGLIQHLKLFCQKSNYSIFIPDEFIPRDIDNNKLYEFAIGNGAIGGKLIGAGGGGFLLFYTNTPNRLRKILINKKL